MKVKVFKLKQIKLLTGVNKDDLDLFDVKDCKVQPILPTYGKEGDGCMDVYPILCEHDVDKDRFIYHTGLAFNIGNDTNGEPNEMSLRPRSNLTKSDFYMPNAPATLDWGYRGELLIIFKNRTSRALVDAISNLTDIVNDIKLSISLPETMNNNTRLKLNNVRTTLHNIYNKISTSPYKCDGNDRCCQLIINSAQRITWEEVNSIEELGESERGDKGFGEGTGGAARS